MELRITKRAAALLFFDAVSTYAAYWLAAVIGDVYADVFPSTDVLFSLGILALFNIAFLAVFRLYNNLWEYASVNEALQITVSLGLSTFTGALFIFLWGVRFPLRVYFMAFFFLLVFCGGTRLLQRVVRDKKRAFASQASVDELPRTLIVGAGETGSLTIARMATRDPLMPGVPVVACDDDANKQNLRIHGVKVRGTSDDILDLVEEYGIEQIVVAIPSASLDERRRIYEICTKTDCRLRTLPNIRELSVDELDGLSLRDVDVNDLLGRDEIVLNTAEVSGYITGKTILVTGGGGSIGSELARQLCTVAPRKIVVFDMYENDAYMLRQELLRTHPDVEVLIEIGNICDMARIREVFERHRPTAVFHAAAHKHVPLMETCPREAVQNNVFGTLNVVRCADEMGVERFVFISTDKAVNPTSVMGATKRMGEMIVQYYARTSSTVFSAVRFGNVLGSSGSVIPLFKKQIAEGGPVTVTHPDIQRYFMTIPEASRLIIQAGGMAHGGEVFILDMGDPVKIVDLATSLIRLSGLVPGQDVKVVYTGLRRGEKMYEELLMDQESTLPTDNSSIMVSAGEEIGYEEVAAKIEELAGCLTMTDAEAIEILKSAVPTYTYTPNDHEDGE